MRSIKQFSRWLVRDRRTHDDPLAHLAKMNAAVDRRHERRALSAEEFARLIEAAETGRRIQSISGPDRAMMYILSAWTGYRKQEIGSLTLRLIYLDDDPPTATVQAAYSKRKRRDTQILHREVVRRLKAWLASKPSLESNQLLFLVSGKVPGGTERKTAKMMRLDLESARDTWIKEATTDEERLAREKSDYLCYRDEDGRYADFHSNRHTFITSLERVDVSPRMAQSLARHSDIRLTMGVYTHIELHDQRAAIESLPPPPSRPAEIEHHVDTLRATGTDDAEAAIPVVPTMVPRGANIGAILPASKPPRTAPICTSTTQADNENGDPKIAVTPDTIRTFRTERDQSTSHCTDQADSGKKARPGGFEPPTCGLEVHASGSSPTASNSVPAVVNGGHAVS